MANYLTIATIHILVGFEIAGLGFLQTNTNEESVEALMIIAFLLYLASVVLTVLMKAGDLAGNTVIFVSTLILVFLAGKYCYAFSKSK